MFLPSKKTLQHIAWSAGISSAVLAGVLVLTLHPNTPEWRAVHTLEKLIPENLSRAHYVRLDCQGAYRNWPEWILRNALVGNAWLIQERKETNSLFLINGCEHVRLYNKHVLAELRKKSCPKTKNAEQPWPYHQGYIDGKLGGEWGALDLNTDVTNVLRELQKIVNMPNEPFYRHTPLNQKGRLLLFAANVAKAGKRNDAVQIATLLFKLDDPQKITSEAVNQIADARYAELCRALSESGDRQAFLLGLKNLLRKMGDRWAHRMAIERQISSIQNNSGSISYTEEEKAFLAAIDAQGLGDKHFMSRRFTSWWILPNSNQNSRVNRNKAIDVLLSKRLGAFPFLIRLLDDYTPTAVALHDHMGLTGPGYRCMTGWHYMDPILMADIRDSNSLLPRPVTRAEIAYDLLRSTIWPMDSHRRSFSDKESVDPFAQYKSIAQTWYDAHKDKSDLELCREFMSDPYTRPNGSIQYLIEHGTDDDIKIIEQKLLTEVYTYNAFERLLPYVRSRGKKAESFLSTYEKAGMEHIDNELKNNSQTANKALCDMYQKQAEKNRIEFRRILKDLRNAMQGTTSTQSILQDIVSHKVEWNTACNAYWKALELEPPETGLLVALRAALQANDAFLRRLIIGGAVDNVRRYATSALAQTPEEMTKIYLTPEHITAWRDVLNDTRSKWREPYKTSELASFLESLLELTDYDQIHDQLLRDLGNDAAERFIARAYDRLNNMPENQLTSIPNADHVSPKRRSEIATDLLKSKNIDTTIAQFALDERLALAEIMKSNTTLNQMLLPYANRILKAELKDKQDADLSAQLQRLKGCTLSTNIIQSLITMCTKEIQNGRFISGSINRASLLRGVQIEIKSTPPKQLDLPYGCYEYKSYLSAWIGKAQERTAHAVWPVMVDEAIRQKVNAVRFFDKNGQKIERGGGVRTFGSQDEINRKLFWHMVDTFVTADDNVAASNEIGLDGEVGKDQ